MIFPVNGEESEKKILAKMKFIQPNEKRWQP